MTLFLIYMFFLINTVTSEYKHRIGEFNYYYLFGVDNGVSAIFDFTTSGRWFVPYSGCDSCRVDEKFGSNFNTSGKGFHKTKEKFRYEINGKYNMEKGFVSGYIGYIEKDNLVSILCLKVL